MIEFTKIFVTSKNIKPKYYFFSVFTEVYIS